MKLGTIASITIAAGLAAAPALAQEISEDVVKIGVLTDMSGPLSDIDGPGTVAAAELAIEDAGGMILGKPIELVSADMLNKPATTVSIGSRWYDAEQVDVILGAASSSASLALSGAAADKGELFMAIDPGTSALTNEACNPYTVHWTYDSYALANVIAETVVQNGGKSWYFITADYAFGHSMEADATRIIEENGGEVLGSVRPPFNSADFSSYLLQAQASGAEVIGLATAGGDMINVVKQAAEFGVTQGGQQLVGFAVFVTDVKSMGLDLSAGLQLAEAWYWDKDEASREFTERFKEKMDGRVPTSVQAGYYGAITHYLKAIEAAGTDEAEAVIAKMKELPTSDPLFGEGYIREDGRKIHDMYIYEVKSPEESEGEWDFYKPVGSVAGEDAFRPAEISECALLATDG